MDRGYIDYEWFVKLAGEPTTKSAVVTGGQGGVLNRACVRQTAPGSFSTGVGLSSCTVCGACCYRIVRCRCITLSAIHVSDTSFAAQT